MNTVIMESPLFLNQKFIKLLTFLGQKKQTKCKLLLITLSAKIIHNIKVL